MRKQNLSPRVLHFKHSKIYFRNSYFLFLLLEQKTANTQGQNRGTPPSLWHRAPTFPTLAAFLPYTAYREACVYQNNRADTFLFSCSIFRCRGHTGSQVGALHFWELIRGTRSLPGCRGHAGNEDTGDGCNGVTHHSFLWGQDEARVMKQHWLKVWSAPFSVFWKSQDAILQATWGSPQQDKATYVQTAMATGQRKDNSRSKSWVVCIGGRGWVFIFVCFSTLGTVFQVKIWK